MLIRILSIIILSTFFYGCMDASKTPSKPESTAQEKQKVDVKVAAADNDDEKKIIDDVSEINEVPVYNKSKTSPFHLIEGKALEQSKAHCIKSLKKVPNPMSQKDISSVCNVILQEKTCYSESHQPIFHFEKKGSSPKGKRILAISLVHGDEHSSGTVTARWIQRLQKINARNTWRVIPVVNPDGWDKGSRINANGVDINRNFPSKDWEELALNWWKKKKKSDPRRFPGNKAASESETRCLMTQINNFKPDFIIAIHTPLGLLDFDGPEVKTPSTLPFPWQRLGNFPGSLGRYMWKDHKVPVLTIELKGSLGIKKLARFDRLQDISGTVAMRASQLIDKDKDKKKN